jgi:hypothetical protein
MTAKRLMEDAGLSKTPPHRVSTGFADVDAVTAASRVDGCGW